MMACTPGACLNCGCGHPHHKHQTDSTYCSRCSTIAHGRMVGCTEYVRPTLWRLAWAWLTGDPRYWLVAEKAGHRE